MKFAFFDGDLIGSTIEKFLLNGDIELATALSANINLAMVEIKELVDQYSKYEILIWGGDDILITSRNRRVSDKLIKEIRTLFKDRTNCSMSCGVGSSIKEAMENLGEAKESGRNKVVKK